MSLAYSRNFRKAHAAGAWYTREKMLENEFGSDSQTYFAVFLFFCFAFFFFLVFCLFRVAPTAYGGSQARGPIIAVATGLHHSYSNTRSSSHDGNPCFISKSV